MNPTLTPAAAAGSRLHAFDTLRAAALLAGLALHGALSYLPGAERYWIVADAPSRALALLFYLVHCCRMPVFFLLAGFFAAAGVARLGAVAFARDRLRRIVLPLLMFWPLVMTGIVAVVVAAVALKNGGSLPAESPPGPRLTPDDFPLTHLWFLYVLALFYAAALVWRALLARLDPADRVGSAARAVLDRLLRPGAISALGLPLAACLARTPDWLPWFGVPTPDQSLYPNLAATVGFGLAFAVGWQLQRSAASLLPRLARDWPRHLLVGIAAAAFCLYLAGPLPTLAKADASPVWPLYAIAYAAAGWSLCLAAAGAALRHADAFDARRRYLADASYWIYLLHLPLLMALQVAAAQLAWPWWIEYPLSLALCLAVLLAAYALFVRDGWLGALLNGRRRPRHAGTGAAAVVTP
ncbi:acyltransferase [Tahibacter caeni]|uniref:acyltransferase n=1 Tax=Tahibacter caeni TaxID=1453545 RepID=UPI002147923B|nr:acyltransferase [Tahibacter caeni]